MRKRIFLFSMLCLFTGAIFGQDLQMASLESPTTACGHSNSEQVEVRIFNFSGTTATVPYTISYQINGGTVINQTITGAANNIPSPSFKDLTFTTTANMSTRGIYNFKVWVSHPSDANQNNDTLSVTVNSDSNSVGGNLITSDTTVCTGNNGALLQLTGNVGKVIGWFQSIDNGSNWTPVASAGTDSSFTYSNLTQTTWYAVAVRSGVCSFDSSNQAKVNIDSVTIPGTISGAGNVCVGSSGTLTLNGFSGTILDWESTQNASGTWNSLSNTTQFQNYFNIQTTSDTLFRAIVKLGVCPSDTSPVAAITLDPLSAGGTTKLLSGATSDTVCTGSSAGQAFIENYTGTILNWEVSTTGATGTYSSIGMGGMDTITLPAVTQNSHFRARTKSGGCPDSTSTPIFIRVDALTNPGAVNTFATICKGGSQAMNLTGNNGTILFWQEKTNSTSWAPILPLVTGSNFTYSNADSTRLFRVIVQNGVCPAAPSDSGVVIVLDSSNGGIITTTDPKTVCANNNSGQLVLSGFNGGVVNWFLSTNGGASFSPAAPVVASDTFNFSNISTTTVYRVQVQNAPCPADVSDTSIISVLPASDAGSITGIDSICSGDTTSMDVVGFDGAVVVWQSSTDGGANYSNVAGSAGQTHINPTATLSSLYRVVVQKGSCDNDTSASFAVTVSPTTVPGTVSGGTTVCGGNNSGSLTLAGETGTNKGWIFSTNGGATWTATGNTTSTFNYTNLTQTTLFRVRVQSGVCDEDTSTGGTIVVIPAAVGGSPTLVSPNDSVCASSLTVTLSLSGQTGAVVGWEASENGGTSYTLIGGASGSPTAFTYNFTTNTLFRALVRNGVACDTVRSDSILVVVGNSSVGGSAQGTDTVCSATNNGFVTLTGQSGDVNEWQFFNGATWVSIANSDSVVYNYSALTATTLFRAVVQDVSCPSAVSDSVEIFVLPGDIPGQVNYAGGNICSGAGVFTMNLTGSSGTIIRWENSADGISWSPISNTTTSITDSNVTVNTLYRAVLQSDTSCPEAPSIADTVFVDPNAVAGAIVGNAVHCDTGNTGFIAISGFTGTIEPWRRQVDGGGFTNVSGSAGSDTIFYTNLPAGTYEYKAILSGGVCPNDTSAIAVVKVDDNVNPGTLTGGASYCNLTNSTLLQLISYVDSVVVWQQSTNGGASYTNIPSSTGRDTITFNNVTTSTVYRVIVSSGLCGFDTSNTQSIDVGQSIGGTLSQSDSVCISGHTGLLTLTGFTGSILVWQDSLSGGSWNDLSPSNAGIDTLRYTNLLQTTSYRVAVQSGSCDTSFSTIATITVNDTVFAGTLGPNNMFLCDTTNSDTLLLTGYFGPIKNWQVSTNGGPFTDFVPAKTDSAFIFNNLTDSSGVYRVIMAGGVCGSDTSNTIEINVSASLAGTLMVSDTVCSGNNMGVIKLTDYSGVILGWDSALANGVFFPTSHAGDSIIYVNLSDTVSYRVRVQNPGCPADTSNTITIFTVPGTDAGNLTGSRSFCDTINTDSIILVGRNGNILLWQSSTNGGATWDSIIGQSTDTLIFTNLDTTTMYRVIIEAAGLCPNDTSNIATVFVGPSDAGVISGDTILCAGSRADLSLNGFIGDVLAWENSSDGIIWNPIPATDTSNISFIVNQNTFFRAFVQSDTCTSDTSAVFTVNVDQPFTGSIQTPTSFLCYGVGADTMFIQPAVDTVFDWEFRADTSVSFTSLSNTSLFQTFNNLTLTTHYRAFVKNGICPVDTTEITLTVDTNTLAGTLFQNDTVCSGTNSGTLHLEGHIGNNFTWQSSTDGVVFGPAAGATNDTSYTYTNLTTTTYFRIIVASGGCPPDTTNQIEIFVKPSAIGGVISSDTSFCKGPNGGVLKLAGYNGNIVGWQKSIGGSGFSDIIPPIVVDSLVYNNLDTTTSYRVILELGDCPDDTSSVALITILPTPVTGITANDVTEFCEPGQVTLTATGGPGYSWSTGDSVDAITVNATGNYIVVVTDTLSGCTDTDSLSVTVFPAANVDAGSNTAIILGQSVTLNATGASSYEWSPKSDLSDGFIANPVASPSDSITYFVVGIDSNGCEGRDSVLIAVIPTGEDGPPEFTNLFTPNGDGHNDTWKIRDLANCNTCKVAIYNRYGQQVLQDDNYQDDWTGTSNGANLPDGSYFYVIESESGKIFKGSITILRGE